MRATSLVKRAATAFTAAAAVIAVGFLGGPEASAAAAATAPVLSLDPVGPIALGPATPARTFLMFHVTTGTVANVSATVKIDLRGLTGVAEVTSTSCTVSRQIATCTEILMSGRPGYLAGGVSMTLSPAKGAKLGATGSYTVTGSAADVRIVGGSGSVTVGGPELRLAPFVRYTNLRVGSTVSEQVRFTNVGNRPSAGAQVLLTTAPGFAFDTHYRNCSYLMTGAVPWAFCRFPGTIRLGESVALAAPVTLRVGSQALYGGLRAYVMPLGDPEWNGPGGWRQGTGGVLGLKVLKAGRASSAPAGRVEVYQTFDNGAQNVQLIARNTADLGVWGATASGGRGSTVPVTVGIYNHGPADIYSDGSLGLVFAAPPGTTVVKAPWGCGLADTSVPNVYACQFTPDYAADPTGSTIMNGAKQSYTFRLRIDKVIRHATGGVSLFSWHPFDPNPRNDHASVVLN
ncbi:hypothetical protein ABIA32_004871 [Streptacidiphilus sp. MAP12-20]|uniref:hypothetical protein n=1 Tax=Streptacidiphilus sp. MAP12-20 TaxID=3156299 RepID=UPI00351327B3